MWVIPRPQAKVYTSIRASSCQAVSSLVFSQSINHVLCLLVFVDLEYIHILFARVHVQAIPPFTVYMSGGLYVSSFGLLY
jgi:hypothetical protein